MNPGIAEKGRRPNILGENERRCRNATGSKLIDLSLLSYIKEKRWGCKRMVLLLLVCALLCGCITDRNF
jgi:hypothetical protein